MYVKDFPQSYSQYKGPKPKKVWAFRVPNAISQFEPHNLGAMQGIKKEVLDLMLDLSEKWTGWGFLNGRAWLLFQLKNDAMYAKIALGNGR